MFILIVLFLWKFDVPRVVRELVIVYVNARRASSDSTVKHERSVHAATAKAEVEENKDRIKADVDTAKALAKAEVDKEKAAAKAEVDKEKALANNRHAITLAELLATHALALKRCVPSAIEDAARAVPVVTAVAAARAVPVVTAVAAARAVDAVNKVIKKLRSSVKYPNQNSGGPGITTPRGARAANRKPIN